MVDVDGRDPERAPIPWRPPSQAGPGAGFTSDEPWLPVVADAERLCVERQAADPASTLTLVRRLAALRDRTPALQTGAQRFLAGAGVLAWLREDHGDRLLAAVNFGTVPAPLALRDDWRRRADLIVSTDPSRSDEDVELDTFTLGPSEAVLLNA